MSRLPPQPPPSLLPAKTRRAESLDQLPLRRWAQVLRVDAADAERARQLDEIGIRAGEKVRVVARAWPSGEPLAVQIGGSRFALRRAEAACVRVRTEQHSKR